MWDGGIDDRNLDHVAARTIDGLSNGFRHFARFSGGSAYTALPIADDDDCAKPEIAAAFDDLRYTVNFDDMLDE